MDPGHRLRLGRAGALAAEGLGARTSSAIPAFDAPRPSTTSAPTGDGLQDQEAGMLQTLQKAVNTARKMEPKVKKLFAERQTKV